jgi:Zn-dependent peptidase ImmA (M78 family)
MSELKLHDAEQFAEKLVKDEKLTLPIDILSIAEKHAILVEPKPASAKGVSGMLIRVGNGFAIAYATHIRSEGFQRFSIAHELGHYFLEGHPESVFRGGQAVHESHAGFGSGDQIELEADHFAAGLLMPSHLFKVEAGKYGDGFEAIENLAGVCKTSLTAYTLCRIHQCCHRRRGQHRVKRRLLFCVTSNAKRKWIPSFEKGITFTP